MRILLIIFLLLFPFSLSAEEDEKWYVMNEKQECMEIEESMNAQSKSAFGGLTTPEEISVRMRDMGADIEMKNMGSENVISIKVDLGKDADLPEVFFLFAKSIACEKFIEGVPR